MVTEVTFHLILTILFISYGEIMFELHGLIYAPIIKNAVTE
jgi:hypothetical protein